MPETTTAPETTQYLKSDLEAFAKNFPPDAPVHRLTKELIRTVSENRFSARTFDSWIDNPRYPHQDARPTSEIANIIWKVLNPRLAAVTHDPLADRINLHHIYYTAIPHVIVIIQRTLPVNRPAVYAECLLIHDYPEPEKSLYSPQAIKKANPSLFLYPPKSPLP